ncbi:MAG: cob(I)yrinic acid a,c-diamide adenosyltransferase [Pseudomonadales bacterium]|nr:cob(I)yrinic acid a,c-diamide adenosyltransferase [Pseudomonadales bacterium]
MNDKTERNRLDKIYTRGGDKGKTSLALGGRLSKADDHIKALGEVDELNCQLGVLIATLPAGHQLAAPLQQIQNILFDMGAELAMNNVDYPPLAQAFIDNLEQQLDQLNSGLPALREFILPGGNICAAHCHLARAVCRRAERQLIQLASTQKSFPQAIKYLNRLSDYLFVAARYLNLQENGSEIYWQPSGK